mgnify:CR=1 FL=1
MVEAVVMLAVVPVLESEDGDAVAFRVVEIPETAAASPVEEGFVADALPSVVSSRTQ